MKVLTLTILFIVAIGIGVILLHAVPPPAPETPGGQTSAKTPASTGAVVLTNASATASASLVGLLTSDPAILYSATANRVTFTAEIDRPDIIGGSVNLQQLDANGNLTILSILSINPSNPIFFSATLTITPATETPLTYRASFAVRGSLLRLFTPQLVVPVTLLATSTWTPYSSALRFSFSYPATWRLATSLDGTDVTVDPGTVTDIAAGDGRLPMVHIVYDQNPNNLPLSQFYNGSLGPDLFTNTEQILSTTIGGKAAIQFIDPGASEYQTVIVVPVNLAFLVIYSNAPPDVFSQLLSTVAFK